MATRLLSNSSASAAAAAANWSSIPFGSRQHLVPDTEACLLRVPVALVRCVRDLLHSLLARGVDAGTPASGNDVWFRVHAVGGVLGHRGFGRVVFRLLNALSATN